MVNNFWNEIPKRSGLYSTINSIVILNRNSNEDTFSAIGNRFFEIKRKPQIRRRHVFGIGCAKQPSSGVVMNNHPFHIHRLRFKSLPGRIFPVIYWDSCDNKNKILCTGTGKGKRHPLTLQQEPFIQHFGHFRKNILNNWLFWAFDYFGHFRKNILNIWF